MYFDSLRELLWMSGHGPYVWSAYAIVSIVLIVLLAQPLSRRSRILARVRRRAAARETQET